MTPYCKTTLSKVFSFSAAYAAFIFPILGVDENNHLVSIDKILTSDSSRYWPADQYQKGMSPPSYDKQFIHDYLV
jgi:hypothetical protein